METFTRRDWLGAVGATLLAQPAVGWGGEDRSNPRTGVAAAAGAQVRTGGARTIRIDAKYDVWVKEVGSGKIDVLTLHGGPGFNHFYLECLEDFLPRAGVRFWYYDQLGCGFSDAPDDVALWTVERYRDEIEQVRRALGLERFILYGHSWGGMLGMEYALRYGQHLAGLVVSNMTASVAEYVRHAAELVRALPPEAQAVIARYRASGDYDAPEYQRVLMDEVYSRHVCRLRPWPEPLQRMFRFMNAKIYNVMQGPDEFNITGNFKEWDIWKRLPEITVPTLVIAARHDEMSPEQLRRMAGLLPRGRYALCERGSHMALYDDQRAYFDALIPFLQQVSAHRGA